MTTRLSYAEAAIANGAALQTGEVDLRNHDLLAIEMPATWTAASITLQGAVRNDGAAGTSLTETFQDVFDSAGAEVTITAVQGHYVVLTQAHRDALQGLGRVKFRSGTTGTPVNQGAARILRFVLGQSIG